METRVINGVCLALAALTLPACCCSASSKTRQHAALTLPCSPFLVSSKTRQNGNQPTCLGEIGRGDPLGAARCDASKNAILSAACLMMRSHVAAATSMLLEALLRAARSTRPEGALSARPFAAAGESAGAIGVGAIGSLTPTSIGEHHKDDERAEPNDGPSPLALPTTDHYGCCAPHFSVVSIENKKRFNNLTHNSAGERCARQRLY